MLTTCNAHCIVKLQSYKGLTFSKCKRITKVERLETYCILLAFCLLTVPGFAQQKLSERAIRQQRIEQKEALEIRSTTYNIKFRNMGSSIMSGRVMALEWLYIPKTGRLYML